MSRYQMIPAFQGVHSILALHELLHDEKAMDQARMLEALRTDVNSRIELLAGPVTEIDKIKRAVEADRVESVRVLKEAQEEAEEINGATQAWAKEVEEDCKERKAEAEKREAFVQKLDDELTAKTARATKELLAEAKENTRREEAAAALMAEAHDIKAKYEALVEAGEALVALRGK